MSRSADMTRHQPTLGRTRRIHMVGIGGIGMSSIAEVLLARGYAVSGTDVQLTDVTSHLEELGAVIHEGHSPAHLDNPDVVIYSSAIEPESNPETAEAESRRIPLISRAVMLGELMRTKFGVGIAGTHGKTTTTTIAGMVVAAGGFDPTIIVGGKVSVFGSNARTGEGDIILVEADEYDRTFLRLTPSLAVITNIEEEHLDTYDDLGDILDAYVQFADSVPFFGATIVCLDDPNVQVILERIDRRVVTYGYARQADVRAEDVKQNGYEMTFDVYHHQTLLGNVRLRVPGHHNVQNALAAIAVGLELDMDFEQIRAGLDAFTGVQRRLQEIGYVNGVRVVDDYAHHPTELRATLEASAECWKDSRIVAVFQPHLYSRTRDFLEAFARSFFNADVLVVMDIYGAREEPIDGIDGSVVADLAQSFGHREVHYVQDRDQMAPFVAGLVRDGDVVLTLGAGDIWRYGRKLVKELEII